MYCNMLLKTGAGYLKIRGNRLLKNVERSDRSEGAGQIVPVIWGFKFKSTSTNFFIDSGGHSEVRMLCMS